MSNEQRVTRSASGWREESESAPAAGVGVGPHAKWGTSPAHTKARTKE